MNKLVNFSKSYPLFSSFLMGMLTNLALAPLFFFPALVFIGLFALVIHSQGSYKQSTLCGYCYGFGYFLAGLYWISIGVSVYSEKFWWVVPIALILLPAFFAQFFALLGFAAHFYSKRIFFLNSFTALWIGAELLRTYLYTGFPWNLIGYSLAFSDIAIQMSSILGIFCLSFIVIFTSTSALYIFDKKYKLFFVFFCMFTAPLWIYVYYHGSHRLKENRTIYTPVKFRLVQPSVPQIDKWNLERFWDVVNTHKDLSLSNISLFNPDMVIWPESAVVVEPSYVSVYNALKSFVTDANAILITGGVTDNLNNPNRTRYKLFVSMYAMDIDGSMIFDYHKAHLVPFGEYVPFSEYINYMGKITPGEMEYFPGDSGFIVSLPRQNLKIKPLICYEVIFPSEVLTNNKDADVILNVTNDGWYGVSSGPYQHFYSARIRAVESGLPLIRTANNGISAIIDGAGRIIAKTNLNDVVYLDGYVPQKLTKPTEYSINKGKYIYYYLIFSFIIGSLFKRKQPKKEGAWTT
ncbi:MAG: apolipoprotein N-acyltransferase [Rickettsiaceae bacterium]|nr:apolipoprotein N-acyltransferase [Rickettsiaceae bacterium]